MIKMVVVRFTAQGWHNWPDAPPGRAYLADSHRHLFHVEIKMGIEDLNREVEFHDLLDFGMEWWSERGPDFSGKSCEMLAEGLLQALALAWPNRTLCVGVFEDGEVGAEIQLLEGKD